VWRIAKCLRRADDRIGADTHTSGRLSTRGLISGGIDVLADRVAAVGARLVDGAYLAWQFAQIECDLALIAWKAAAPGRGATAHMAYRAALDREEAAARDLEELRRLTGELAARRA
jgi:hypothetical protein